MFTTETPHSGFDGHKSWIVGHFAKTLHILFEFYIDTAGLQGEAAPP